MARNFRKKLKEIRHGDTIIEVVLAITIFSAIAVSTIAIMNGGISQAQKALEVTMVRNEINSQAEALRFIHNNYVAERDLASDGQQFSKLWERIEDHIITPDKINEKFDLNNLGDCSDAYYGTDASYKGEFQLSSEKVISGGKKGPFILNTRFLEPKGIVTDMKHGANPVTYDNKFISKIVINGFENLSTEGTRDKIFHPAPLYPRLIYKPLEIDGLNDLAKPNSEMKDNTNDDVLSESEKKGDEYSYYREVAAAEGLWIVGVEGDKDEDSGEPSYYDFYVRSCWNEAGAIGHSNLVTTVRLFNPEAL